MRNFIIAFMLLILFLSIIFAIFKPLPVSKNKVEEQHEKTNVEELLMGKEKSIENIKFENSEQKSFDENFQELNKKDNSFEISNQEVNQNNAGNLDNNKIQNFQDTQNEIFNDLKEQIEKSNINYKSTVDELSSKYKNNPNAEVSEEDFKYYFEKLLRTNNNLQAN